MWSDLRAAVPQESSALQSLASSLPDVALARRAPSTSSNYFSSYNRWRSWGREHGLTVFPVSPFHIAVYLRHLMIEAKKKAVHSISWFHQLGGEPSPSDHPLEKSTLAGAQRFLARQTIKKEPIAVSQLEQLVASKADSVASLYNIRSVVVCSLPFAAFLRFDELAKLVRSDVKIEDVMLKLFIQSSKTDWLVQRWSLDCCSLFQESNLSGCCGEPELRSSRPKVMLPEVMLPETGVMLPEILCHVARKSWSCRPKSP